MVFVRVKIVKGKEYAYLVQNYWRSKRTVQHVKQYLGRVFRPHKLQSQGFYEFMNNKSAEYWRNNTYSQVIQALVTWELYKHDIDADSYRSGKVYAINEGFLCIRMVNRIKRFKMLSQESQEEAVLRLATYFVEAGLNIPQDLFVIMCQKVVPVG